MPDPAFARPGLRWQEAIAPESVRDVNDRAFLLYDGDRPLATLWVPRPDEVVGLPPAPTGQLLWRPCKYFSGAGSQPAEQLQRGDAGGRLASCVPLNDAAWDALAELSLPPLEAGPLQLRFPLFPRVPKGTHPRD